MIFKFVRNINTIVVDIFVKIPVRPHFSIALIHWKT